MKKLANHIILSGVTVSMLFSPLMALPSGGKFTHGTSGTITSNGNNMNIVGNGTNSVIQWGGGFNIGKGESVNFGGSNKNYLNIAHGAGKSTIEGVLNAGGNNVFLINPNGVIIEKSGSIINAKNFMASTATLDEKDFNIFKTLSFENPQAFSPKIKPNSGNVVNLGKINATNSITLQGNKIVLEAGFDKGSLNKIETNELNLKGNEVYADVGTTKVKKVNVEANKGTLYLSATGYYYDPTKKYDEFNNVNNKIKKTYNQYISIGSDLDWWHFAKGWNEKADFRNNVVENTFKLTNDIDFKGNQGKGEEGKDWQNYANYCIEGLGCTNMIVGHTTSFNKIFDGQGFTLSNININTTKLSFKPGSVGIFGKAGDGAIFKNINVDYKDGSIKATINGDVIGGVGGFIGSAGNSSFNNIHLSNVKEIEVDGNGGVVGGFVGWATQGDYTNVGINSIGKILNNANIRNNIGGFVGSSDGAKFTNIFIDTINSIEGNNKELDVFAGGFAGRDTHSKFQNITIRKISNIDVTGLINGNSVGGFIGEARVGDKAFDNIVIDGIDNITSKEEKKYSSNLGGFIGKAYMTSNNAFNNIVLKDMGNMRAKTNGGSSIGGFIGAISIDKSIIKQDILFNNVYMHYNDNAKFIVDGKDPANTHYGKFIAHNSNYGETINYNTTNVYFYGNPIDTAGKYDKYIDKNVDDFNDPEFQNGMNSIKGSNFDKDSIKPSEKEYLSAQEAKNDQATLTKDDLYKDIIINEIIADLKDKYYTIDIADLKAILEAYKNLDKNSAEARTKFIMDYFFDKNNKDNPSMEIAQKEIFQSLDFLLAYQDNGLDKAGDDKFANKEAIQAKNDILTEVSNALENKTITNNLEKLNNLNDKINSANNDFKEKNYYKRLNDLALSYNKYIELINKGLASKDDQAFKDISNKLFALIAQVGKETEAIEKLIKDFEGLKIQVSENSNGRFVVKGELSAIKIPYPILASIKDDNNGGGIEIPDKPELPETDLDFEQTASLNSIGNETLNEEEEQEEIDETSLLQKSKTCIVSDNYKTMNPCVAGM